MVSTKLTYVRNVLAVVAVSLVVIGLVGWWDTIEVQQSLMYLATVAISALVAASAVFAAVSAGIRYSVSWTIGLVTFMICVVVVEAAT
jgi:hypothetical protein